MALIKDGKTLTTEQESIQRQEFNDTGSFASGVTEQKATEEPSTPIKTEEISKITEPTKIEPTPKEIVAGPTPTEIKEPIQKPTEVKVDTKVDTKVDKVDKPQITTIADFKDAGGTQKELSTLLENRGTENIEIIGNRITGERNGERFQWTIDGAGNPIRKPLGTIANEKEDYAKLKGINFNLDDTGKLTFQPGNLDEAIDLFNQFGSNVKIDRNNLDTIRASAVFQKYNKYKNATPEIYFDGLNAGEIAEGGETWNRLIKMNGGEPTEAMLVARRKFELKMKTDNINKNGTDLINAFGDKKVTTVSTEQDFRNATEQLDKDYLTARVNIFADIENQYAVYKQGTEATNDLRKQANDTASKIDELNVEKRNILKGVKDRFPQLPLSAQLKIARDETESVDDELFALQRQYNIENADYQYADTQDKAEFEFNMKTLDQKAGLMTDLYGVQRGDLIRQEDIARADRQLNEQIARTEEARKQAIIDGDAQFAKQMTYELKIAEEKSKINQKAFQVVTPGSTGTVGVFNPNTGEVDFKTITGPTAGAVTPTGQVATQTINIDGKTKDVTLDTSVGTSLNDAITTIGREVGGDIIVADTFRTSERQQALSDAGKGLVAQPGTSLHEKGLAVDIYNGKNEQGELQALNAEQVQVMNDNGWFQTAGKNDLGHFEYLGKQEQPQEQELLGSLGVPIAFERQIKQQVPTQLMNSEVELKALNETIQILSKAGFSADEAVLTFMGFDIKDEANKTKALNFVDIARTLGESTPEDFIPKVSNFINSGQDNKAMDLTERVTKNAMSNQLGGDFVPENIARNGIERADELLKLIDDLEATGENPLGEFEGTIAQWFGRFKGEESQKVATQAERLIAQFRTDLIGTAGTQTENNNIENLIPKLGDSTVNFKIKVSDIGDEALREVNNQREEFGLPKLDINSLKDKDVRLGLYTGETEAPTTIEAFGEETVAPTTSSFDRYKSRKTGGDTRFSNFIK